MEFLAAYNEFMQELKRNNLAPANIPQTDFSELGYYEESRIRSGAGDGIRTRDLLITNLVVYLFFMIINL